MPACLIDQEHSVCAGLYGLGDLHEMQVIASVLRAGRIGAAPLPCFGQTAPNM